MNYLVERIRNCTRTCIICDDPLPFQMVKPAVCDKNLCCHSHEQYGLGMVILIIVVDYYYYYYDCWLLLLFAMLLLSLLSLLLLLL